jgi:antagonist of KipI
MDSFAFRVANLLLGNGDNDAALEITLTGPSLSFDEDAFVALTGGDLGARIGDTRLPPWRAAFVPRGSRLTFAGAESGSRAYLAIAGGIDVPVVLGSRSTLVRARFGGYEGRALMKGDVLHAGPPGPTAQRMRAGFERDKVRVAGWGIGMSIRPAYSAAPVLRVMDDAQATRLGADAQRTLYSATFAVSRKSDRMGVRLEGTPLPLEAPVEVLSEAVAFGTLQLPPDGNPIVLMADRQTTGGYPRLGEIATVDLPLVAQLRPGDEMRFRRITLPEAQSLYLARERDLTEARREIALRHPGSET